MLSGLVSTRPPPLIRTTAPTLVSSPLSAPPPRRNHAFTPLRVVVAVGLWGGLDGFLVGVTFGEDESVDAGERADLGFWGGGFPGPVNDARSLGHRAAPSTSSARFSRHGREPTPMLRSNAISNSEYTLPLRSRRAGGTFPFHSSTRRWCAVIPNPRAASVMCMSRCICEKCRYRGIIVHGCNSHKTCTTVYFAEGSKFDGKSAKQRRVPRAL
jgi:hypothetical protein